MLRWQGMGELQLESIESIIGTDRTLELQFDSRNRQLGAQDWAASLWQLEFDDNYEEVGREKLASARLVRVSLLDDDWLDSLDAESGDLQAVGSAFEDWDRIADLHEPSALADSLVVIDFLGVPEEHRGARVSEALARGIAHIFRSDIIALIPDSLSASADGKLYVDDVKKQGLRRHWARSGFLSIPGFDAMFLPVDDNR